MKQALLVIDFINEIVEREGKLSGKGYADFIEEADTFTHLNNAIGKFRKANLPVIFVRLAFEQGYENQPKGSPLFGKAQEFGILEEDSWSTEISSQVDHEDGDHLVTKSRVSAFYMTELASLLEKEGITDLYIAGVATDLAVQAAARDAHDRDYNVFVVADACAAANTEDHVNSLTVLQKIGTIVQSEDIKL